MYVILPIIAGLLFQETYSFNRTYKVGDKDRYESVIEINGQYSAVVKSTIQMTVKKVFPNGEADIETKAEKSTAVVMGQVVTVALPKPTTARYDATGMELKSTNGIGGMPNFMRFAQLAGKTGLKLGESVDVEDKSDLATVTGKYQLVSVKDGIADIRGDLTVATKEQPNPYTMQIQSFMVLKDGKPRVTTGIVRGLVSDPGAPKIDRIQFTVTRLP